MEQLTLLEELQELRGGARKSARRARKAPLASATSSTVEQRAFDFDREPPRLARVFSLPIASARTRDAEAWYQLGCEAEPSDPARARDAYGHALAIAPGHADAHLNLGCLDHEAGRLAEAEAHYRAALAERPDDVTARFDLAVVLEDRERTADARAAYLACLDADPACAEAHYNLARLCERAGDPAAALRHLMAYRRLQTA